jgi:hypothetical protein
MSKSSVASGHIVKEITVKMGMKQHGSAAQQCTCTLVTGDQTVPYQAQHDSFEASSIFPLLSLPDFPFSAIKEFSERIVIPKCRGSLCKSGKSSDRGIETSSPGMLPKALQTLAKLYRFPKEVL